MVSEPVLKILVRRGYLEADKAGDEVQVAEARRRYRQDNPYVAPLHPSADAPWLEANCEICRDAGFVHPLRQDGTPDFGRVVPCRCSRKRLGPQQYQVRLDGSGLPPPHRERRFNTFQVTDLNARAHEAALNWAIGEAGYRLLLVYGVSGNGKTHLAHAATRELAERGFGVMYVTFADLLDRLRAAIGGEESSQRILQEYKRAQILVLDDVGMENATAWTDSILEELVDHRYSHEMMMMLTTNEAPTSLPKPVYSRLMDTRLSCVVKNRESNWRPKMGRR